MTLTIEIASPLAESIIAMAERAGIPAEEHAIRLLEVATERDDVNNGFAAARAVNKPREGSKPENGSMRASAFGKYTNNLISSYQMAEEKQGEIAREDRLPR